MNRIVAGASIPWVNRWLGWKAGERAAVVVKALAGVGVMLGGVYFVWTAV